MDEKIILNGQIKLAETNYEDNGKPYIKLVTRLCYLDYPNLNNVGLSSSATESFETLVDMPIVAKINYKGNKFGSHEVKVDSDGNYKFNTSAYGVHTEVYVEDDEVDIPNVGLKTVPCLFAKSKVWKRFENVCELIINKMENPDDYNGGLYSSWELQGTEYNEDKGYKEYTKFTFLANCLIDVQPAYGKNSKTLEISSDSFSVELSEAYEKDILIISASDNKSIENIISDTVKETISQLITSSNLNIKEEGNIINESNKGGIFNMTKKKTEISSVTMRDLSNKLSEAIDKKMDSWLYLSIVFPETHKAWAYRWDRESELDYYEFTYSVDENDVVTVSDPIEVKLTALPAVASIIELKQEVVEQSQVIVQLDETAKLLSQKEIKISEKELEVSNLQTKISELETELSAKIESINKLGEEIANKDTLISEKESIIAELTPLKEEKERLEAEKIAQEIAQKKEDLKIYATKGDFITKEELETSEEIKKAIEELDEKTIKLIRAERIEKKFETSSTQTQSIETSSTKEEIKNVKTDLSSNEEGMFTATQIIKNMLSKNK